MGCLDRETATAYLRGDLEPHEAEQWAAHLAICDACRHVVEEISALIDAVRQDLMRLDVGCDSTWQHRQRTWPSLERMIDRPHREPSGKSIGEWLNAKTISLALASVLFLAAVLWVRGASVSAAEILQRASTAERTADAKPGDVLFRVVTVEERRGTARTLVSRRRVETWRKTGTSVAARRAYNEVGRLVAAEWIDNRGGHTVYASGHVPASDHEQPVPARALPLPARALLGADESWRLELSAATFSSLIDEPASARASETPSTIRVTYESTTDDLVAAALTLSKSDLRAIEQTVQLGRGPESRELRIAEDRVSHMEPDAVAATVFKVDASLESPELPSSPAIAPKRLSDSALMGLEVEALHVLDGAGALLGEQVNVTRTPAGLVQVDATVDSSARKEELERALAPLSRTSGLHIRVETFEAAASRDPSRDRSQPEQLPVVREVEVQKDDIPVGRLLRDYFSASGGDSSEEAIAERVRALANRAVEESQLVVQHAWAMKSLAGRFRPDSQRVLDEHARAVWQTLIRQHAAAIANHGSRLRELLQPAFFPEEAIGIPALGASADDIGLAAERILALAHTQDDAVRAALVTSATSSAATTFLQTQQFWNALTELVAVAQRTATQ